VTEKTYGQKATLDICHDLMVGTEQANVRWEPYSQAFVDAVRSADVVVDAGAEYGFYTALALKFGKPTLVVVAIEAERERADMLAELYLNDKRVDLHCVAVGAGDGLMRLIKPEPGLSMSIAGAVHGSAGHAVLVECESLDTILALSGRRADVIKMDIEGAEDAAVRGMPGALASATHLFIEFHQVPPGEDRAKTVSALEAAGFLFDDESLARAQFGGWVALQKWRAA
jgi:FkbM family methyltransferase